MNTYDLSTVIGCAGFTYVTVAYVKGMIADTRFGQGNWVLLIVAIAAAAWTFVASSVFHTLQGNFGQLALSVFISALGSVGTHAGLIPLLTAILDAMGKRAGLILLLLMVALPGCVNSKAFQAGAHRLGQAIAADATEFVTANPTTLPAEEVQRRLAQAESLRVITLNTDLITVDSVKSSWETVRAWYLPYLAGDQRLSTMLATLQTYLDRVGKMDRLVREEEVRRAIWTPAPPAPAQ